MALVGSWGAEVSLIIYFFRASVKKRARTMSRYFLSDFKNSKPEQRVLIHLDPNKSSLLMHMPMSLFLSCPILNIYLRHLRE